MKKHKLIGLILCAVLLISSMLVGASANVFTPNDPRNDIIDAGILLYMGYGGYGTGNKYARFTDDDLDQVVQVSEDFVLLTIPNYNWYYDNNDIRQPILTMDDIRAIRPTRGGATWANGGADTSIVCSCAGAGPDWDRMFAFGFNQGRPGEWEFECSFLWEMWHYARNMNWMLNTPTMTLESLVYDYLDVAVRLVERNPNVRLWLSFPATEHMHILTYRFTQYWIEHIVFGARDELYARGLSEIWHNNIVGFYYGNEEIVPFYTPFNRNAHQNPNTDYLDNSVVWGMRQLADVVRDELDKKFLWIPTVNINGNSLEVVGLIANRLNIFDAILLQPNYYFREIEDDRQARTRQQVWAIREWVKNQVITEPGSMGSGEWVNRPGDGAYVTKNVWDPDIGRYVPVMEWDPDFRGVTWSNDGGYDTNAIWDSIIWWEISYGWCYDMWWSTGEWVWRNDWNTFTQNPSTFWRTTGGYIWASDGAYRQVWSWDSTVGSVQWSNNGGYSDDMWDYINWWSLANGWCIMTWWDTGEWVWVTNSWDVLTRNPADFWNDAGGWAWVVHGAYRPAFEWDPTAGDYREVTIWDPNAGDGIMWVPNQTGTPFGGEKVSFTQIGFHMELDANVFQPTGHMDRWLTYVAAFRDLLGFAPSAVYAGHPWEVIAVIDLMDGFFNGERGGGTTSAPESTPESAPESAPSGGTTSEGGGTVTSAPGAGGGNIPGNNPPTGDTTPIVAIVMAIIALLSSGVILATNRKKAVK